jgi:ABC-type multidrug transport system fused ATPase/permease subunit
MKTLPPILTGTQRFFFCRLIVNGVLQAAMIVGSMLLVRHAFDVLLNPAFDDPEVHLFDMSEVGTIGFFAAGLLVCTFSAALLRLLARIDAERLGQEYVHRVRLTLYDHMGKLSSRALGRRSTGGVALRFVGDLSALRRWVSLGLARIVVALTVSSLALGFLTYLDPYLAAVSLVILCIGLIGNLLLGPRMNQATVETRKLRGRLAGNINEKIQAIRVMQAFNQIRRERRRFGKQSRRLRDAMISKAWATGFMRVVTDGSSAASMGLVLSLGALEVFKGMTSAGNVVAAMAVVAFLSNAVRDLGRVHEYRQSARVSERKIVEFLSLKTMRGRSSKLPPLQVEKCAIRFEAVGLGECLKEITATAPGGSRIALTGTNGSGKSTLLQLAARLIDPTSGRIFIDGQNLLECNMESVRSKVGIVSPDFPLLRGSIRYNLLYRCPQADEGEIARIRSLCNLDELFASLPGGETYRLQEAGQNLSLGQRHRLTIARAILGNPSLLILDEIDANLDEHSAAVFDKVLDEFPGTVLMVTRSENRLKRADYHWHLKGGRLLTIEPSGSKAHTGIIQNKHQEYSSFFNEKAIS